MSPLEDEIRDALRSEAAHLREVRPLRLEPAPRRPGRVARTPRARRLRPWLAPVTAAALVIALAISLVIVRATQNGPAVPAAPQPSAPTAFPRYYATFGGENTDGNGTSLVVGDSQFKTPLATIPAPAGMSFETTTLTAAADDRTFLVAETLGQRKPPYPPFATTGPTAWFQIRVSPESASQVTMTRLAISGADADLPVMDVALSGDGRYLAVALGDAGTTRQELQIYSVSSGQLLHTWSMAIGTFSTYVAISALTWINGGDETIEFGWGENRNNTQVRTLSVSAPGTSLLTASHVAWSHYFPPPGNVPTSMECGSLTITADGRTAMDCVRYISKTGGVSPVDWLGYPISASASPSASPRVIAAIPAQPATLKDPIYTQIEVVYVSAHEVIGYSAPNPSIHARQVTIHEFIASGNTVRQLGTGTIPSIWGSPPIVW